MTRRLSLLVLLLLSSFVAEGANLLVPLPGRAALTVTNGEGEPARVAVVFYGASNERTIVNVATLRCDGRSSCSSGRNVHRVDAVDRRTPASSV